MVLQLLQDRLMSISHSDRQQLLEQKRQRLQELKQRRLLQQLSRLPTPEEPHALLFKKRVDATTQTQYDEISSNKANPINQVTKKEIDKYDKSVQTTTPIQIETPSVPAEKKVNLLDKQAICENDLNEALTTSIKTVNKIQITKTIQLDQSAKRASDVNLLSGFNITATHNFKQTIRCMDVLSKSLALAFTDNEAVVYDFQESQFFPEFYLKSLSGIEIMQFDKYNNHRIIGGLSNGGICIWELGNSSISLMPVLSTPLYSSILRTSALLHLDKIVYLTQFLLDGNPCILSVSRDGVVNVWSANLLVEPKLSFKIFGSTRKADDLQVMNGLYLGPDEIVGTNFILDLIVATNDGRIYKGNGELVHEDCPSIIGSLIKLDNLIISSHSEWNFKIWKQQQVQPFKDIPTPYIVRQVIIRPQRKLQLVTVGYPNLANSRYVVDIWDLSKKVYSPITTIMESVDKIDDIAFNETGDTFIVVVKGNMTVYSIDDSKFSRFQKDDSHFDKGI